MRLECPERFPRHRIQRKTLVSDPGMHHGTCVTHVPWCMPGSLTRVARETFPAFSAHAQFYVSGKRPMVILFISATCIARACDKVKWHYCYTDILCLIFLTWLEINNMYLHLICTKKLYLDQICNSYSWGVIDSYLGRNNLFMSSKYFMLPILSSAIQISQKNKHMCLQNSSLNERVFMLIQ